MRINEIYMNITEQFDDLDGAYRLCLIRDIERDKVKFSVPKEYQPEINKGIIFFERSTFAVKKTDFEKHFVPAPDGYTSAESM